MRTIQSPGVELSEIDLSLRPSLPVGTNVLIAGFSQKGPTEEVIEITSTSEFEQVYGAPTNAAERYFYHTVKAVKSSPANAFVYRLPYGGEGDNGDVADRYSALVYPIVALSATNQGDNSKSHSSIYDDTAIATDLMYNPDVAKQTHTKGAVPYKDGVIYYIGEPQNFNITSAELDAFQQGEYNWSSETNNTDEDRSPLDHNSFKQAVEDGAGLVIINNRKNIINEKFEGYYVGLIDNTNLNPATDFDGCLNVYSVTSKLSGTNPDNDRYLSLPTQRLNFPLSGSNAPAALGAGTQQANASVSEVLENLSDVELGTPEFDDMLAIGVFKIRQSVMAADTTKLDYMLAESYVGSLNGYKKANNPNGGTATSDFIEDVAEGKVGTPNIQIHVNPYISQEQGDWFDHNLGVSKKKVRVHTSKPADDAGIYLDAAEQTATFAFRENLTNGSLTINASFSATTINQFTTDPTMYPAISSTLDLNTVITLTGTSTSFTPLAYQLSNKTSIDPVDHWTSVTYPTSNYYVNTANALYPSGVFKDTSQRSLKVGAIPTKLERMFEVVDNYELYPLDLTVEAGLGTIYVGTSGGRQSGFNDEAIWPINGDAIPNGKGVLSDDLYQTKIYDQWNTSDEGGTVMNYRFVNDAFVNFAANKRKDLMHISDNLRWIFVQGKNAKTLNQTFKELDANDNEVVTQKYFSKHIYWPLRHIQGNVNSSYSCAFGNWVKVFDGSLNRGVWAPFSGFAAGMMANTDANFQPWYAPAGFTRGVLNNVSDLALYPKLKERDQLYKINMNPVANFPNDGFVVFGQKTLQRKPSAFDRINVRRLFLYLEKAVRATVKYFIFEPNTLFTRTQVVNVLTPIFENVKNTEGMYDYLIVCDERNNTPDVIDQNEMVIDIYIKPVRAAEFILVNFYATRTSQDFSELVG